MTGPNSPEFIDGLKDLIAQFKNDKVLQLMLDQNEYLSSCEPLDGPEWESNSQEKK